MTAKEKVFNGWSVKATVAGVIIGILGMIFASFIPDLAGSGTFSFIFTSRPGAGKDFGYWYGPFGDMVVGPWMIAIAYVTLIIFIIVLINTIVARTSGKVFFTRAETAVITLLAPLFLLLEASSGSWQGWMTYMGQFYCITLDPYTQGYSAAIQATASSLTSPIFTALPNSYMEAMKGPNAIVQWGYWWSTMGWMLLFMISLFLFGVFTALIAWRIWVKVENLPFPGAAYQTSIIELVESSEESERKSVPFWSSKFLLMGFVITFIWMFIGWGKPLYWFTQYWGNMDSYWNGGVFGPGVLPFGPPYIQPYLQINLLKYGPQIGLPYNSMLFIDANIWLIAWGFMQPTSQLVGMTIGGLIFLSIVPTLLMEVGVYPVITASNVAGATDQSGNSWVLTGSTGIWASAGLEWGLLIAFGGMMALLLQPLWRHRKEFMIELRSIYTKVPSEIEQDSPIPYRYVWIGLIVFFILSVAAGLIINVNFVAWTGFLITMAILNLGILRMATAETSGYFGGWAVAGAGPHAIMALSFFPALWIYISGVYSSPTSMAWMTLITMGFWTAMASFMWRLPFGGSWLTTYSMKVSTDLKVNKRKWLMWAIVCVVVAFVICAPLQLWFIHWLGNTRWCSWVGLDSAVAVLQSGDITNYYTTSFFQTMFGARLGLTIGCVLVGIVMVVALNVLSARFPKLAIIGPAGLILSFFLGAWIWWSWFAALIIKTLVLRVGGMKLYKDKALPFFIGCVFAAFLLWGIMNFYVYLNQWNVTLIAQAKPYP